MFQAVVLGCRVAKHLGALFTPVDNAYTGLFVSPRARTNREV